MPHIHPKKSLGQNFLKSKEAVRDIIRAANISADDLMLEIGPGKGVLTEALLAKLDSVGKGKVVAIEKDDRLIVFLKEKFVSAITQRKLVIAHGDILEIPIADLKNLGFEQHHYKIIANIPYYITGQLLRTFLESEIQPSKMVLMLQKEVAQRIVARDGKESILSISVKAYGQAKYIAKVPAKYFSPEPRVDSAILLIDNITKDFFQSLGVSEENFFSVVKKGFAHKRKQLGGNLELSLENRAKIFGELGIKNKARAEDLSLEQWGRLAKILK